MKILTAFACLLTGTVSLTAASLNIDDFDAYADDAALKQNWNSFGVAATAGPPVLEADDGVDGSNGARFALDWRGGKNNANARRINLNALDLTEFSALSVTAYIKTRDTFSDPTEPTLIKLAIEGANGAIWQTSHDIALSIVNDSYEPILFPFSEMELVDGSGTLPEALQNIANFRLRFENHSGSETRQDAFFDNIVALTDSGGSDIEAPNLTILPATEGVELEFTTQNGQLYQIQRSTDLNDWTDDGESVTGSGEAVSRIYPTEGTSREFFRVVTREE